jgi:hypothetical protein
MLIEAGLFWKVMFHRQLTLRQVVVSGPGVQSLKRFVRNLVQNLEKLKLAIL